MTRNTNERHAMKPTTALVFKVDKKNKSIAFTSEDIKVRQTWGDRQTIEIEIPPGEGWCKRMYDLAKLLDPGMVKRLLKADKAFDIKQRFQDRLATQARIINTVPRKT